LIESELFGYKAGAFTDAKHDKPGRFALAQNGTIFLDEIGDISAALQVRLLRVLQERVYEPLGSNKPLSTNARVIVATHRNLEQLVKEERFREDLYYRINVFKVLLPRLAERKEDIPLLVDFFIQRFNLRKGRSIKGIAQEAISALMIYDWPGNVRELENATSMPSFCAATISSGSMNSPRIWWPTTAPWATRRERHSRRSSDRRSSRRCGATRGKGWRLRELWASTRTPSAGK
jgi:transcriptional regulator with PAS, ATPase and Fis domain